jgi:hypothetical protein
MDLVFVIDERTAPFADQVRAFLINTLNLIANKRPTEIAVAIVSVGTSGRVISSFTDFNYGDISNYINSLSWPQSSTANLGEGRRRDRHLNIQTCSLPFP